VTPVDEKRELVGHFLEVVDPVASRQEPWPWDLPHHSGREGWVVPDEMESEVQALSLEVA
jgi:hypothetical protein